MIFINLLPDIKLEYTRALRIKRLLVLMSAVLITCCIIVVSVLFFYAEVQQPRQIARIEGTQTGEVDPDTNLPIYEPADSNAALLNDIKKNEQAARILTIQNQLRELPNLRSDTTAVDRLFQSADDGDGLAYLDDIIPGKDWPSIESATFDFENNTFTLTGSAEDRRAALLLELTIKYAGVKEDCEPTNTTTRIYPFRLDGDIVLPPVSISPEEEALDEDEREKVNYQLSGIFSQDLFNPSYEAENLKIVIPAIDASDPSVLQPDARCILPESNDQQLNPISGNAAASPDPNTQAAEDANEGEDGDNEE